MTQKFYVTLTWHDWPEGGSYGTVVEAKDHNEAEQLARQEMAETLASDHQPDDFGDKTYIELCMTILSDYGREWHLVDCFKVADFHNHPEAIRLLNSLLDRDDLFIDTVAADVVEQVIELLR